MHCGKWYPVENGTLKKVTRRTRPSILLFKTSHRIIKPSPNYLQIGRIELTANYFNQHRRKAGPDSRRARVTGSAKPRFEKSMRKCRVIVFMDMWMVFSATTPIQPVFGHIGVMTKRNGVSGIASIIYPRSASSALGRRMYYQRLHIIFRPAEKSLYKVRSAGPLEMPR